VYQLQRDSFALFLGHMSKVYEEKSLRSSPGVTLPKLSEHIIMCSL